MAFVIQPTKKISQHTINNQTMPFHYKKGSVSATMPGRKDFTTKKTSKMFNRGGHRFTHALGNSKPTKPYGK